MRVLFSYTAFDGSRFVLPLEVNEHRPFGKVLEDAHEIATEVAGNGWQFLTCVLPRHSPDPAIRAMDELRRIGSLEGPFKTQRH